VSQTLAPTKLFCTSQVLSRLRVKTNVKQHLSGDRFWDERHEGRGGRERKGKKPWRRVSRDKLVQALTHKGKVKRLAVVCAGGYGKSANLEWLAAMLAKAGQVVFRFVLDEWEVSLPAAEAEFWDTFLPQQLRNAAGNERLDLETGRRILDRLRSAGRLTLLFDSVDQASERGRLLVEQVLAHAAWACCPVVITSRPDAVFDHWGKLIGRDESAWRFVRVEPLAEEQRHLLLGPDVSDQNERRRMGKERYEQLPEAGRQLLANPRNIEYVRKCAKPPEPPSEARKADTGGKQPKKKPAKQKRAEGNQTEARPEPELLTNYRLEDLRTASHLFAGAVDHLVESGFAAEDARRLGLKLKRDESPPEKPATWQQSLALDLLAALAYAMYCQPHPSQRAGEEFRPNVSHVRTEGVSELLHGRDGQGGVKKLLVDAEVPDHWRVVNDLEGSLKALSALNAQFDFCLLDRSTDSGLRWHDRTLEEFLAAWWLSRYATAEDVERLRGWRYDNRMAEAKSLYSPLWGFLVEMPKAVRTGRWFEAVGALFEHGGTRCCEMIYRCCETLAGMSGKERRKSDEVLAEWRREFAGMTGEVAEGVRTGIVRLECNGKLPGDTGRFMMGSPAGEAGRDGDEHYREERVQAFGIGVGPVTNGQYELFDAGHKSERRWEEEADIARHPVVTVDWWEAWCFCQWVGGRLPTEVEWEYACRGGTTTPYYWGDKLNGTQANCDGNHPYPDGSEAGPDLERTSAVGSYAEANPHPWGLVDVHGNVWEWCANWYDSEQKYRMLRGGSWNRSARDCRAAFRDRSGPANRYARSGFRVVFCLD
jgi:sulfatase modifying factor 1